MAADYVHPGGLPDGVWGRSLVGKRLRLRLLRAMSEPIECEVVESINDWENWHTCFVKLRLADGLTISVNPLAIGEFAVLDGQRPSALDDQPEGGRPRKPRR